MLPFFLAGLRRRPSLSVNLRAELCKNRYLHFGVGFFGRYLHFGLGVFGRYLHFGLGVFGRYLPSVDTYLPPKDSLSQAELKVLEPRPSPEGVLAPCLAAENDQLSILLNTTQHMTLYCSLPKTLYCSSSILGAR